MLSLPWSTTFMTVEFVCKAKTGICQRRTGEPRYSGGIRRILHPVRVGQLPVRVNRLPKRDVLVTSVYPSISDMICGAANVKKGHERTHTLIAAANSVWECLDSDQYGAVAIHVYLCWLGVSVLSNQLTSNGVLEREDQRSVGKGRP